MKKVVTDFQKKAANRVDELYIHSQDDPRYRQNMFGEDPKGKVAAKGNIEPMKKIADARSIARSGGTPMQRVSRPVAEQAAKRVKLLDALTFKKK